MKRLLFLVAILAIGTASSAFAADYGTAGCGLGAMAFKDQPGKIQIVAATLNNIISPQTFAITSGTSNCVDNPETASAMFITVNQQALRTDISRGSGESIASLSKLLKCSDADQLGASLQKNYSAIFPTENTSATQINDSIHNTIKTDSVLSKECAI